MAIEDDVRRPRTRMRRGGISTSSADGGQGRIPNAGNRNTASNAANKISRFQRAIDAGYDPVKYGYDPATGQRVGTAVAQSRVATRKAEAQELERGQAAADLRAGVTTPAAAAPAAAAPAAAAKTTDAAAAQPVQGGSKFRIDPETKKPIYTGGYIDGKPSGAAIKESRLRTNAYPTPGRSERLYDEYVSAVEKWKAGRTAEGTEGGADTVVIDEETGAPTPTPAPVAPGSASSTQPGAPGSPESIAPASITGATAQPTGPDTNLRSIAGPAAGAGRAAGQAISSLATRGEDLARAGKTARLGFDIASENTGRALPIQQKIEQTAKGMRELANQGTVQAAKKGSLPAASNLVKVQKAEDNARRAASTMQRLIGAEAAAAGKLDEAAKASGTLLGRASRGVAGSSKLRLLGKAGAGVAAGMDVADAALTPLSNFDNPEQDERAQALLRGAEQRPVRTALGSIYRATPAVFFGGGQTSSEAKAALQGLRLASSRGPEAEARSSLDTAARRNMERIARSGDKIRDRLMGDNAAAYEYFPPVLRSAVDRATQREQQRMAQEEARRTKIFANSPR